MRHHTVRRSARRALTIGLSVLVLAALVLAGAYFLLPERTQASVPYASMEHGWNLILINSENQIPKDWDPELTTLANGQQVDSRIYPELQQMFDDMRAQEIYPVVASGYRTAEKQQELMDEKVQEFESQGYLHKLAQKEAKKWVNTVGCSEHQTGLAVDINADGIHSAGEEVYNWLAEHAWEYGFILRYPQGKTALTGTDYEPWHYRYVGKDDAAAIHQQGVCLEEYIAALDGAAAS